MTSKTIAFKQPTPLPQAIADDWVQAKTPEQPALPLEPTKRLTVDVPKTLHTRIKTSCASGERQMNDVLCELLMKAYPAP